MDGLAAFGALAASSTVRTVALGAAAIGALAGLAGGLAVLRREALLGDALAHAALPGICLGFLLAGGRDIGAMMAGAAVSALLAAGFMRFVALRTPLRADAALGLGLSLFFAAGVVLLTAIQARGGSGQGGLSTFLFGQAAALLRADAMIAAGAALAAALLLWAFAAPVKLALFDRDFARVSGLPTGALDAAIVLLMALTVIIGLQLVGVVMMVALLIAPAVAARQWTGGFGAMLALSAAIGAASGLAGTAASASMSGVATGPAIVLAASAAAALSLLVAPGRGILARRLAAAHRRKDAGSALLAAMDALARRHGDPAHPVEQGTLEALFGGPVRRRLAELERRGLVRETRHDPETTPHYVMTEAGRAAAGRAPA